MAGAGRGQEPELFRTVHGTSRVHSYLGTQCRRPARDPVQSQVYPHPVVCEWHDTAIDIGRRLLGPGKVSLVRLSQ